MIKETMTPKDRIEAAIKLEPYDRVPVAPLLNSQFPARHKGMTSAEGFALHDEKKFQALVDLFDEVGGWDAMLYPGAGLARNPEDSLSLYLWQSLSRKQRVFFGEGLPVNSPPQYAEREVFTVDDYDEIIRLGWEGFVEKNRERPAFLPHDEMIAWARNRTAQYSKDVKRWEERGIPTLIGAAVPSPLMYLSLMRSLTRFTMDIYRIPDKVQAVMDTLVDYFIKSSIDITRLVGIPGVILILERGGCFYYSLKIFERFEFPYIKKMTEAFASEGILSILHFDQDYTLNLPYFRDLPKKMCICELDSKTDIFKAKKILKDHMCIMGDVLPSLLSLGTPQEVKAYCQKLIDIVGKDTGFILSSGCSVPDDTKFENFKMMIDTAKNCWPHG